MAKNATREMTSGSPLKLILSFAVPLLLGMLFQQFYSMVDTIIVGKSLGVDQLAGCRIDRSNKLYDNWILQRCLQRICYPNSTKLWRKGLQATAKICRKRSLAVHRIRSCYDSCRLCTMQTNSFLDGYTRKYFRICL